MDCPLALFLVRDLVITQAFVETLVTVSPILANPRRDSIAEGVSQSCRRDRWLKPRDLLHQHHPLGLHHITGFKPVKINTRSNRLTSIVLSIPDKLMPFDANLLNNQGINQTTSGISIT